MPGEKFISRLMSGAAIVPLAVAFALVPAAAQDTLTATAPVTVDAKAEAAAKKKADRARQIAERDAREAADYTPLGSHVRDESVGSVRIMGKDELARREAGKDASALAPTPRVPLDSPTAEDLLRGR